jgi:hypothetical protein
MKAGQVPICRVCLLRDATRPAGDRIRTAVGIFLNCEERLRDPRMVVSLVEALREIVQMSEPTLAWTSPHSDARLLLARVTGRQR